jgi:hypothetical protein
MVGIFVICQFYIYVMNSDIVIHIVDLDAIPLLTAVG